MTDNQSPITDNRQPTTVSLIAAMSENRVIGKDNKLPWHIPGDFRHFKNTTMGKPVIMGRRTFESLGRPLPGRSNIIVSRSGFSAPGAQTVPTLEDALALGKKIAAETKQNEIFVIGGAQVYEQALPFANRIYLTIVHKTYEGDAFFPALEEKDWRETSSEHHDGDPVYTIKILDRA